MRTAHLILTLCLVGCASVDMQRLGYAMSSTGAALMPLERPSLQPEPMLIDYSVPERVSTVCQPIGNSVSCYQY